MADHSGKAPTQNIRSQVIEKLEGLLASLHAGEDLEPLKLLATLGFLYKLVDTDKLKQETSTGRPERALRTEDNNIQNQL